MHMFDAVKAKSCSKHIGLSENPTWNLRCIPHLLPRSALPRALAYLPIHPLQAWAAHQGLGG